MRVTPKFKEKYAKRLRRLLDTMPLRKQAFIQVHTELRSENVRVDDRTLYRWMADLPS